ncbi:kelch repeat-containing family protein [Striga asiatica]|uniref:Kelch repeat-containing family protein n=1 Tax=Striga asiatica TaxID=4170 RepID=A0A5A7QZQ5_STRAF|nr:kelch repeat-containing family protein [Striga asiatica]
MAESWRKVSATLYAIPNRLHLSLGNLELAWSYSSSPESEMVKGKKNKTCNLNNNDVSWISSAHPSPRNLKREDLGAVIFGCKHHTFNECINKKIFGLLSAWHTGLPAAHYSYVRNIPIGLTLFLFNYSDRKLHGIFEASSTGQLDMDKYAWAASEGADYTPYSAQVRVDAQRMCRPLLEEEFKPVIEKNYYTEKLFRFELDRGQAKRLIKLFLSSPLPKKTHMAPPRQIPARQANTNDDSILCPDRKVDPHKKFENQDSEENENYHVPAFTTVDASSRERKWTDLFRPSTSSCNEPKETALEAWPSSENAESESDVVENWEEDDMADHDPQEVCENADSHLQFQIDSNVQLHELEAERDDSTDMALVQSHNSLPGGTLAGAPLSDFEAVIVKMKQEIESLKVGQLKQRLKMHSVEQELVHSKLEIIQLKNRFHKLETMASSISNHYKVEIHDKPKGNILVVGGFNGTEWLSDLCSYSPLQDNVVPLCPMTFPRSSFAVAKLNGELFIFGGTYEGVWYDTVESYNSLTNQWVKRPSLNKKKGGAAGASLYETIFAVGGGDGVESFSEVELLDLNIGSWISTQSMLEKRFGASAAVMNGSLYVAGGYDGKEYLRTVERFDPRQHAWSRVASMNSKRGCHSLVAFNGELYAMGGYDGDKVVPTVEVFEPRVGSWMMEEPMKSSRVNFGSFVFGEKIYVIGGMKDTEVLDVIECYESESGWQVKESTKLGKRSFFSALVI